MHRLLLVFSFLGLLGVAHADSALDRLLDQAREEAAAEVQLHVIKTHERMSGFTAKVRKVEQVPGWPQIRAQGEAAFAAWDNHKRDFTWRSEKFEVLWDIVDARELRVRSVSFGGIKRDVE